MQRQKQIPFGDDKQESDWKSSYSLILLGSRVGAGYSSLRERMASTMICEMATLRYHLWSAGITNQDRKSVV